MKYLSLIKNVPQKRVFRLIISQCSLCDDAFANILDGIINQSMYDTYGNLKC